MPDPKKDPIEKDRVTLTQTVTGSTPEDVLGKVAGTERTSTDGKQRSFNEEAGKPDQFITILRQAPKRLNGESIAGTLDRLNCPMREEEIRTYVEENYGGGKYWIGIVDDKDKTCAAKNMDIPGVPKVNHDEVDLTFLDEEEMPSAVGRRVRGTVVTREREQDPEAEMEQMQRQETRRLQREIHHEQLLQQHKRVRQANSSESSEYKALRDKIERMETDHHDEIQRYKDMTTERDRKSDEDRRSREIDDLRKDVDSKFQQMLETIQKQAGPRQDDFVRQIEEIKKNQERERKEWERDRDHRERELERRIEESKSDQQGQTMIKFLSDHMNSVTEQAAAASRAAKEINDRNMEVMKEFNSHRDKLDDQRFTMLREITKEQGSSKTDVFEQIRGVFDIVGQIAPMMLGSSGEPEDLSSKMIKLVEKAIPELLKMRKNPDEITRQQQHLLMEDYVRKEAEKMKQQRRGEARRVATEAVARERARQRPAAGTPGTSAAGPVPQATTPQTAMPPPSTSEKAAMKTVTPESKSEKEASQDSDILEMKDDYTKRVDAVLRLIIEEIDERPDKAKWVKEAWHELPDSILQKILRANSDTEVYDTIRNWADDELMDRIYASIKDDEKCQQWIIDGVNRMKDVAMKTLPEEEL